MLVPTINADAGYRFVVFSQRPGQSDYEAKLLAKSDEAGAADYFLRGIPIGKFVEQELNPNLVFDKAHTSDVILLFLLHDSGAFEESEVDVYYWSEGRYKRDVVSSQKSDYH